MFTVNTFSMKLFLIVTTNIVNQLYGTKFCGKLPSYLEVVCRDSKTETDVECRASAPVGAVVVARCKPWHHSKSSHNSVKMTCRDDGTWNERLLECEPYCGRDPGAEPLIHGGVNATNAPWNVAVYRLDASNFWSLICGGTLIAENLVISAAHCFHRNINNNDAAYPVNIYEIAVSKYSRSIDTYDNEWTQRSKIKTMYFPDNPVYAGAPRYEADLVILQLEIRISFGVHVFPACLDRKFIGRFDPPPVAVGQVVGFGETENENSPSTLKLAHLPYIRLSDCRRLVGNLDFANNIAIDKFCAGYPNGTGVAKGDSGAGLLFYNRDTGSFYLRGVVSNRGKHLPVYLAAFTDVAQYMKWIDKIMQNVSHGELRIDNASRINETNCSLPANFVDKTYDVICPRGNNLCHSRSGEEVTKNSQVMFTCRSGYIYKRSKRFTSFCTDGGNWVPSIEKCLKICDELPSHLDYIMCKENEDGPVVLCNSTLVEGAVATPRCKAHYRAEYSIRDRYVTCLSNGTWDVQFITCTPECGKVEESLDLMAGVNGTALQTAGWRITNIVPWHVMIYVPMIDTKNVFCSGTLLSSKAVISAAHCFYNYMVRVKDDKSLFEIAVGKHSRDMNKMDYNWTQRSTIRNIYWYGKPSGKPRFQADIVILWLNNSITLSEKVLPICIDEKNREYFKTVENPIGQMTSFVTGKNSPDPQFLMSIMLPYISQDDCSRVISNDINNGFILDKFCAGSVLGVLEADHGDSGSGLVFRERKDGLYYLRGVLSYEDRSEPLSVLPFTDVAVYTSWINTVLSDIDLKDKERIN